MFSQRCFLSNRKIPLLHPDLTHAHIYTHTHAIHIPHTSYTHSDALTHTHAPLVPYASYTCSYAHILTHIRTGNTHTPTHTIRFMHPLRCTHTHSYTTYRMRHTPAQIHSYAHTHTLHTTHTICGSRWGLITSVSRNNGVSARCPRWSGAHPWEAPECGNPGCGAIAQLSPARP